MPQPPLELVGDFSPSVPGGIADSGSMETSSGGSLSKPPRQRKQTLKKGPFDPKLIYRSTKCFTVGTNGYPGGFPKGFLKYLQEMKWWGEKRCYLCAGKVGGQDPDAVTVDIKPEVAPTVVADARNTPFAAESFDCVIIDPPYSRELADELYGTAKVWSSINAFTKEAARIVKPGGLIVTLGYEVPKRIEGCDFIAVVGVYQIMNVCHMRCLAVARKRS